MAGRISPGSVALQARILAAIALLVLVYAGIGWLLVAVGVPVYGVVLLAEVVLLVQWCQSEPLACAVANARPVDEHQAPEVHAALDRLCALTGQPKPRVAVAHDMAANAFTVGRSRRHTTMIVTSGLLRLDPPELEAALAHELAHIDHRDVAVMTLASSFASALVWLLREGLRGLDGLRGPKGLRGMVERSNPAPSTPVDDLSFRLLLLREEIRVVWLAAVPVVAVCALVTHLPLRALSRYRELAADRTAALWLGRPALLAATLVKVHGRRDQIPRTDLRASGIEPLGLVAGRDEPGGWLASHPPLDRRLAQLDQLTRLLR